jgi:hypothetical protein
MARHPARRPAARHRPSFYSRAPGAPAPAAPAPATPAPATPAPAAPPEEHPSENPVESRVPCGEYHTQSGKVGAIIRRSTDRDGRATYSYTGQWGAGSGLSYADMMRDVDYWMGNKRGVKVITQFVGASENPRAAAPAGSLLDPSFGARYRGAREGDDEEETSNIFWRHIAPSAHVVETRTGWVVHYGAGKKASAYWGSQDARQAQQWLRARAKADAQRAAPNPVPEGYRVAYLGSGARREYLAGDHSLAGASAEVHALKRRGMTAWVEDAAGAFVPIPGATRQPKWFGASENPLDISTDGWVHWHGDPPNEVGNLGPGQMIQTTDGWWYRQDTGGDAGKLYFQAEPGGSAPVEAQVVEIAPAFMPVESIPYGDPGVVEVATFQPVDVDVVPELPIEVLAVENPVGGSGDRAQIMHDEITFLRGRIQNRMTHAIDQARVEGRTLPLGWSDRDRRMLTQLEFAAAKVGEGALDWAERIINAVNSESSAHRSVAENPRGRGGGRSADSTAWRSTPEGTAKYRQARADAQRKANETGFDYGVEANDIFKSFNVMMLPRAENRSGYELRVEVVHPERLGGAQPGHGPMARGGRS